MGEIADHFGIDNDTFGDASAFAGRQQQVLVEPQKAGFFTRVKGLFVNDGASRIYTLGGALSGTVGMVSGAAGVGIYINPKNDLLFFASLPLFAHPSTLFWVKWLF
ncbi:hypothetical protein K7I13_11480 [Brucepastera parasyntrophica]|uniref:hypothetical protein n=1 Tax=Brucepastera parasyntrophica TaxID=2880008 RepID=UPI00210B1605|nr:hypothetical protein [Brucepastera parasyntrophica]ULQ61235.1 hypothetical protein K7I13_11480 [Brucepastera parasyntrophica]